MYVKVTDVSFCSRELEKKEIELGQYKRMSLDQNKEMGKVDDKDKEITKLQYMVSLVYFFSF